MEKDIDIQELTTDYFQKKSRIYRAGAYRSARRLSRNAEDYQAHFYAFLIDLNICLLPVYIWVLEFILILCGIIPPSFFNLLLYIMFALLFIVSGIGMGVYTSRSHGQSIGYALMGLKLVNASDKKEASSMQLILRQLLYFGIPMVVFGYFFQVIGVMIWWLVNGAVVLLMGNQQSIFDIVFRTVTVNEPEYDESKVVMRRKAQPKPAQPKPTPAKPVQKPKTSLSPIDMHLYSNYSENGQCDVEELFKLAKQKNLKTISITDHNCARANAAAARFSELYDIQYIPGIEIDAQYKNIRVRVLGYYIDWTNSIFDAIEKESLQREKKMSIQRVELFEKYTGISVDVDSLLNKSRFLTISGQKLTAMLFNNKQGRQLPLVKQYLMENTDERIARQRFVQDVFGPKGPCYVPANYISAKDAIQAIHQADGIAILSSWNMDNVTDQSITELMDQGFDGIECFSPRIHVSTRMLCFVK